MKTIEELDALHAAATEGEWFQDPTKAWVVSDGVPFRHRTQVLEGGPGDRAAIVALHNAWPEVYARLRAAEAECERLRALCRDAAEHIDPMRWGHGTAGERALVARLDRAALGKP